VRVLDVEAVGLDADRAVGVPVDANQRPRPSSQTAISARSALILSHPASPAMKRHLWPQSQRAIVPLSQAAFLGGSGQWCLGAGRWTTVSDWGTLVDTLGGLGYRALDELDEGLAGRLHREGDSEELVRVEVDDDPLLVGGRGEYFSADVRVVAGDGRLVRPSALVPRVGDDWRPAVAAPHQPPRDRKPRQKPMVPDMTEQITEMVVCDTRFRPSVS